MVTSSGDSELSWVPVVVGGSAVGCQAPRALSSNPLRGLRARYSRAGASRSASATLCWVVSGGAAATASAIHRSNSLLLITLLDLLSVPFGQSASVRTEFGISTARVKLAVAVRAFNDVQPLGDDWRHLFILPIGVKVVDPMVLTILAGVDRSAGQLVLVTYS
jgi:hypothetical protein